LLGDEPNRVGMTTDRIIDIDTLDTLVFKPSYIHGMGMFASRDLKRGTMVIEYLGQKIDKRESLRRCEENNFYIFALDDLHDLDGDVGWNPAKFINHSCSPNCEAELIDGHVWIVARRDIHIGEEITFNYGYDLGSYQEHPCRCGSAECVGYIVAEEFFEIVRERTARLAREPNDHAACAVSSRPRKVVNNCSVVNGLARNTV